MAVKRAETFGIARYLVEQDRRRIATAFLSQHLGDRAHLGVPMRAVDSHQFIHFFDAVDPPSQVAVATCRSTGGRFAGAGHRALLKLIAVYILIQFSETLHD